MGSKASSLLSSEMEELSGVVYRPRTKETRATYELLLSFIQHNIGDQVCVAWLVCVCLGGGGSWVCCVFMCVSVLVSVYVSFHVLHLSVFVDTQVFLIIGKLLTMGYM